MQERKVMSRQQEARDQQQYDPNPVLPFCENCEHYRSSWVEDGWGVVEEKKRRCSIGNFAVKRRGTCGTHRFNHD